MKKCVRHIVRNAVQNSFTENTRKPTADDIRSWNISAKPKYNMDKPFMDLVGKHIKKNIT